MYIYVKFICVYDMCICIYIYVYYNSIEIIGNGKENKSNLHYFRNMEVS